MSFEPQGLAELGFENPAGAAKALAALGAQAEAVLGWAASSGDPDAVVAGYERTRARDARFASLFGASDFLQRRLARSLVRRLPRMLEAEKPLDAYLAEAKGALRGIGVGDAAGLRRRLRLYKYRELARIALRDVALGAPMDAIGRETSRLAEALIRAALGAIEPGASGFCVLGLGKLGGEDLNFSSDIDLIYFYRSERQEHFTRLGEALTRALSDTTAEGFCYRVDLNLRPHGRSGAIVLSLAQMRAYYEAYGRTWERAALLKARPVAGDLALGEELLDGLQPFIWRRSVDHTVVDELREMRAQIDLRGKASADDVKLGRGGIREVEFFANALQLLHGGKNPALRERRTLRALRKLEQAGHLAGPDADRLEEAYLFLRRVENRLQMLEERQTQALPTAEKERRRLARSLGFADWTAFTSELERHRAFVAGAFHQLLGRTAREEVPDEPLLALALDLDADRAARVDALARRGFADPDSALAAIERLARIQESPFARGAAGPGLQAVRLMAEVARTPDPDQALLHFADFIGVLRSPGGYLALLERFPQTGRRLLNLFGQSDYLSRYFLGHPELLDALVQNELTEIHKAPERIRQELSSRASRYADPEDRLSALRRYKNEESLRIGMHDIAGELDVPEVARQLTAVADAALDEALFLAEQEQRERYGEPRGEKGAEALVVIGMGKLGGIELGYHSDLDLIFVYGGRGTDETTGGSRGRISHHEYFAKTVQRLLGFLEMRLREGYLYRVDARLRPSGNQGPLVVSEGAFHEHHAQRAQLWERQALIKARRSAGDAALFERIRARIIDPLVYERALPPDAGKEIDRLRRRMEIEIAQETPDQLNAKTGHGGLVDVEFATQYLQLREGGRHPEVRGVNTLAAIDALEQCTSLPPSDARDLREGYLFHRRVENRLRLIHGFSLSHFPTAGRPLELLARRLGYQGARAGADLLDEYRTYTTRVRGVYARTLQSA